VIPTTWVSGKSKTMVAVKKISGCKESEGRERGIGGARRTFRAVKLLCMVP